MLPRKFIALAVAASMVVGLALLAFFTRERWQEWFSKENAAAAHEDGNHAHGPKDRILLSPQARANLRLVVKPITPETFRRTLQVPGVVIERLAKGDRGFVAPVAGVVESLAALPGDIIQPGDELLTLRVNSESLQTSQTELYKTAQEVKITENEKKRLDGLAAGGALAPAKILELQYQLDRQNAIRRAYRADLAVKGLVPEQIDKVEIGKFLKEIVVRAPTPIGDTLSSPPPLLELEELKAQLGEQVQAGQLLGHLANHQNLVIEGRGFREDTELLEKTAALGWPLQTVFSEEKSGKWPPLEKPLTIHYLANTIDSTSQTFPFYVPLPNQFREYSREGKTYRIWRFRPGQRVQLGAPVEEFPNVLVVPVAAVVREGIETYVFRQNGDYFERKPVHVVYEDTRHVVLANDGSITPGSYIAHNAAEILNRALKAAQSEGQGGGHEGHNH